MKLTAYFHLFPPEHCAGSETTVHAALRAMVQRGHIVNVICDRSITAPYEIDGIQVVRPLRRGVDSWLDSYVRDSNLLVTHLDLTSQAMQLAMRTRIPLVHFVHNDAQLMYWRVDARVPYKCALEVLNSHWLAAKPSRWQGIDRPEEWRGPSIVIHPVVEPHHYRCERGEKITLVNPTPTKGADTFKALAQLMPDYQFLAVEGGYGDQVITESGKHAASGNIAWMAHTPEIRNVFRQTKVLLMPSDYESYGRVGIEAACAGIPTVCHPTEGLKEAFGDAGIFIHRDDVNSWYAELTRLLTDEVYYRKRSDAVLALADSLDPEGEFNRLEKKLLETVARYKNGTTSMKMWTCDRYIWQLRDGNFKASDNERIPPDAVKLYAGKGTLIPEEEARRHGWIGPDAKALHSPPEDKAMHGSENKRKGRAA